MTDAFLIAAAFGGELLFFCVVGSLLPMRSGPEGRSLCENVCGGCVLYMALLEVAAFAATLFEWRLSTFSRVWALCVGALAAAAVIHGFVPFLEGIPGRIRNFRLNLMAVFAAVGIAAFVFLAMVLPAVQDTSLVIGQMTQDLYHDTISLYTPGSGSRITSMEPSQLFARYYVHDLFMCEVTGLHPMAEMRIIRVGIVSLISSMATWRIFLGLFDGNRTKAGAGMLLYLAVSFFFQRPYTVSGMLLSSGWTGNAAFAAVVLPTLLLLAVHLYEEPERFNLILLVFASGIAAVSCSAQAILVYPFAALAAGIPLIFRTKDWLYLFRVVLWLIVPAAAVCVCLLVPEIGM